MARRPVGIVSALPEEIRPLRRRLQDSTRVRLSRGKAIQGALQGVPVVILATGDGAQRARLGLTELLDRVDLQSIMAIGIAGGLSPDLEVGDVVVASEVTNGKGEVPPPDRDLMAKATSVAGVTVGMIHSHSEVAIDPVAKERLWRQSGGGAGWVVDLETASYARLAAARGVPYSALRAVSDTAEEALPLDFNRFRRSDGSSDRGRVARYALVHPSIVPELMQLRERLGHCAGRLASIVEEILNS